MDIGATISEVRKEYKCHVNSEEAICTGTTRYL